MHSYDDHLSAAQLPIIVHKVSGEEGGKFSSTRPLRCSSSRWRCCARLNSIMAGEGGGIDAHREQERPWYHLEILGLFLLGS